MSLRRVSKLGVFDLSSACNTLQFVLAQDFDVVECATESECIFMHWLSRSVIEPEQTLLQTNYLESIVKKNCCIVVFDSALDLTKQEIEWLVKSNVKIVEPTIKPRPYCDSLPFWLKLPKTVPLRTVDKSIDLTFNRNTKNKEAEYKKYYEHINQYYPTLTIDTVGYDRAKCSIIIGTEYEYISGWLPNLAEMLDNYCVPLISPRHRFYHALFQNLIVDDYKDVKFLIEHYDVMDYGLIRDFYDRVLQYFPEMKIENVANKIKNLLEA